jgi:hypothetical protein
MVQIKSTKFGEITIGRKTYYSDVVVWWNGKVDFKIKKHLLTLDDFIEIFEKNPEVIVIGAGYEESGIKLMPEIKEVALDKKIKIFIENTPKAIDIFNAFAKSGKKVVGIMHTTC